MQNVISNRNSKYDENALYYFCKDVCVNNIDESIVRIFADARYKMYINGVLVAVGPCKQTSEIKYYDSVNITRYLKQGINKFEIRVLQLSNDLYKKGEGLLSSVIRSGEMRLCLWGNAGDAQLTTDESWDTAKEKSIYFFSVSMFDFYNVASLSEIINSDYRKNLDFEKAIKVQEIYMIDKEDEHLSLIEFPTEERPIPMMYFKEKTFCNSEKNIYDAGKLTCGYVRFKCKGKGKVRLTYAECMAFIENGKLKKRKRDDENGVITGDYDILEVDGECEFEPYWMRTFRYVEVKTEGDIEIISLDYIETGYPIEVSDKYDFGSYKDNALFDISVNTLKRCMHETYMDCPYYEQIQYAMDTYLQILFTYQLTSDKALPEKAIDDFAKSYRVGGLTQSRYPANKAQYIPGFSLFFILMLYEHSRRFGDKDFLRKYIHIADGIAEWFIKRLDGYMVPRSNLWDFIDWTEEYEKGQIKSKEPIAVYSLMLAYALERLSDMHGMLGNSISDYKVLPKKIKESVKIRCFDVLSGLYADAPDKNHFSQHTQVWAVLCNLENGNSAKEILKKSIKLTAKVSSAYMFLLFRAFEKEDIYYMSEEYMDSLRNLVDLGCTTMPEWIGEDVRSECHAWSAVAIYEFTAKVLGVVYSDKTISIKPYIKGRDFARGEVATPVGMVYCEWKITDDVFTIKVELPDAEKAMLTMPDNKVYNVNSGVYTTKIKRHSILPLYRGDSVHGHFKNG